MIRIVFESESPYVIKQKKVEAAVKAVFRLLGKEKDINIAFVGGARIADLNARYRNKAGATDVLSFDYGQEGDLVISPLDVRIRKSENETDIEAVEKTVIHGTLHLFGFDHENDTDYTRMSKLEIEAYEGLK